MTARARFTVGHDPGVSRAVSWTYLSAMGRSLRILRRAFPALAGILAVAAFASQASARFQLGLEDPGFSAPAGSPSAVLADGTLQEIHGSVIRVGVYWAGVAPNTTTMPAGFNPLNPGDRHYNWTLVDAAVRTANELHAQVILNFLDAPLWAEGPNRPPYTNPLTIYPGAWDPNPAAFAQFAQAAAIRYSGSYPDPLERGRTLPRVRYWEIWNEENLPVYLAGPDLVGEYRTLLDAGYSAIKAVDPSNVIVMGGLAPVSYEPPLSVAPLSFAAQLLCVHVVRSHYAADRSCPQRAEFDVFAIHPYSLAATPTKHAYAYDNVLVGDMGKVARLVAAVDRLHTALPLIHHPIWVSEFAWFTNPPDTLVGDPDRVAARYVAYSLYEMWRSGTSLVIWEEVQDSTGADRLGGGLYTESGAPKLMLSAYMFPFIASVTHGVGYAWGRVPLGGRHKVLVQRRSGSRWRTVAVARTAAAGIFVVHFRTHGDAFFRAHVVHGPTSLPYDSHPIPPRRTHLFDSG